MNNKIIDIDRLSRYHENINTLLTTKQESLVSGDNIKTINGESILGSGNIESLASKEYVDSIKVDNIYITDFTIDDLYDVVNNETSKIADTVNLSAAAQARKIIVIPTTSDAKSGCVANIDAYDDVIQLWFYYFNTNIELSLSTTSQEISFENVWINDIQSALISGENIRTINGEDIIGDGPNMELATKDELNAKADDSSVVHLEGDEVIWGTKEFTSRIETPNGILFGPGTHIESYNEVNGETANVIGYTHSALIVNDPRHPLYLHGSTERPRYNFDNVELALLSDVDAKQDAIADLDAIRSGAEKGATALQSIPSEYVTETELTAKGYATTSALNDKVDKVSGKQLSTEDFTTALKAKLEGLNNYDDTTLANAISGLETRLNTLVSGDASTAIESFNEIIAFLDGVQDTQDLAGIIASIEQQIAAKQDKITDLDTIRSGAAKGATALQSYTEKYTGTITGIKMNGASKGTSGVVDLGTVITSHQDISGKADKSSLAAVATSGSYNDLSNKPTIPSAVTESTVSGWGFTKNTGTYSKPSGGIPKTDLTSAVQTSLGKADTALQSYTEQYQGTVQSVETSETLDEVNTTTYVKYVAQTLTDAQKAQARANIGAAAVGEGGGGTTSGGSGAYSEVNHGTSDTTFTLTPNTFHIWDEVSALILTLGSETAGVANEFLFQFTSGATATSLTLPDDIKWANDSAPTIAENMIYQVSILKGLASVLEFKNAPALIENKATVSISGTKYLVSLQYAAASDIVVKVRTGDGPRSVKILSGEISKTANPMGPVVDSSAYIESITPAVDTTYNYTW